MQNHLKSYLNYEMGMPLYWTDGVRHRYTMWRAPKECQVDKSALNITWFLIRMSCFDDTRVLFRRSFSWEERLVRKSLAIRMEEKSLDCEERLRLSTGWCPALWLVLSEYPFKLRENLLQSRLGNWFVRFGRNWHYSGQFHWNRCWACVVGVGYLCIHVCMCINTRRVMLWWFLVLVSDDYRSITYRKLGVCK